ncbi:MAG: alanine racemase [Rhodanobacteraceae bacterium]
MSRSAIATIHLDALRTNLARVRSLAQNAKVMAVVKADAYGHGLERCARALHDADAFGVASIADGLRLRAAGHRQRIVVLSGPDDMSDLAELRRLDLEAVIHHDSQIAMLEADHGAQRLRVWLKLNTGMHRLGFPADRAHELHARLCAMPGVDPDIVLMTHFASSDEFDNAVTARQIARFNEVTLDLPGERSLSNSAGVLGWPHARGDWVRVGGLLYGLSVASGKTGADFGFAPAMTLTTRLVGINSVKRGERVGYGARFECPEDMAIGVAAIGYGDGYPRSAPSGTPVLVGNAKASIVGRISMDLITLDLRQASNARVGDVVTLWGPTLPVEITAQHAGTISYELTCGVTRRVLFTESNDEV